jgi:ParB/RepB/Spo0J family partition protein
MLKNLNVSEVKMVYNHRELGDISGLMKSIKSRGLLNPISVVLQKDKSYLVVDGHRRLSALIKLGEKKVDAIIKQEKMEERDVLLDGATSNEARKSLSVFEKYLLYKKLIDANYTTEEIASALDVDIRTVKSVTELGRHLPLTKLKDITYGKLGSHKPIGKVGIGNAKKIAGLTKSGKLNGPALDKVWETLKKGKRVENINVKNNNVTVTVSITMPLKYKEKFDNQLLAGKAINAFLQKRLFNRYRD